MRFLQLPSLRGASKARRGNPKNQSQKLIKTGLLLRCAPCNDIPSCQYKVLTFIFGMISGLVFAPTFFIPGLLAIAFLYYQVQISSSWKQAAVLGYIFGFGHFLISMYWISIGVSVYIEEFWWAIPFALFGLPIILACFISLSCGVSFFARNNSYYQFAFGIAWIFFEWVRSWIFTGLPWNLIGYAFSFSDILIQPASIIGIYGLSFVVVYIATSFGLIIFGNQFKLLSSPRRQGSSNKIPSKNQNILDSRFRGNDISMIDNRQPTISSLCFQAPIINSIIILSLIVAYGAFRLANNPTQFTNIKIRIVQPSIPQTAKWSAAKFWQNLNKHIKLSESENKPDLVIWSEAALVVPYYYEPIKKALLAMQKAQNTVLITGGVLDNGKKGEDYELYTSLVALATNLERLFEYHKSHLVPFGEYMPLKWLLPLKKLTPGIVDYTEGDSKLVHLDKFALAIRPLICYESIFPNFVRTNNKYANVIINVTNDAWYGRSSGPYQHLQISRMRSVENGIPMLRSANNGISAVIDPVGRIIKKLAINEVGHIDSLLPKKLEYTTLYSQLGDLSSVIAVVIVLIIHYLIKKSLFKCNNSKNSLA